MNPIRAFGFALACVMLVSCGGDVSVGAPAPNFTLTGHDGASVSLKDYRGKALILAFYPGANVNRVNASRRELKSFQRDLAKYREAHVEIVAVSGDDTKTQHELATTDKLEFKLLSDPELKVASTYGATMGLMERLHTNGSTTPMTARQTFLIDSSGNVAQVFTDINADTHSAELLAALKTHPLR